MPHLDETAASSTPHSSESRICSVISLGHLVPRPCSRVISQCHLRCPINLEVLILRTPKLLCHLSCPYSIRSFISAPPCHIARASDSPSLSSWLILRHSSISVASALANVTRLRLIHSLRSCCFPALLFRLVKRSLSLLGLLLHRTPEKQCHVGVGLPCHLITPKIKCHLHYSAVSSPPQNCSVISGLILRPSMSHAFWVGSATASGPATCVPRPCDSPPNLCPAPIF